MGRRSRADYSHNRVACADIRYVTAHTDACDPDTADFRQHRSRPRSTRTNTSGIVLVVLPLTEIYSIVHVQSTVLHCASLVIGRAYLLVRAVSSTVVVRAYVCWLADKSEQTSTEPSADPCRFMALPRNMTKPRRSAGPAVKYRTCDHCRSTFYFTDLEAHFAGHCPPATTDWPHAHVHDRRLFSYAKLYAKGGYLSNFFFLWGGGV